MKGAKPVLFVAGSLNMDFVVRVQHLPVPGETALGREFQMLAGGKGANQACAAGRIGGSTVLTRMAGRVGQDLFADHLKASLSAAGVDVSSVHGTQAAPTGVALIAVEDSGQNSIVVASGANHAFQASEIEALRPAIRGAAFALFQLELPLPTVSAGLKVAREENVRTVLDPAPAQALSSELLHFVDLLTPNETEASILLGLPPGPVSRGDAPALARQLLHRGAASVVLKLGEQGCFYSGPEGEIFSPGFAVEARDTTAAGDVFNAALAVALAEGKSVPDALRFANAAAAISVTRAGAQASAPARAEVDAFLAFRA